MKRRSASQNGMTEIFRAIALTLFPGNAVETSPDGSVTVSIGDGPGITMEPFHWFERGLASVRTAGKEGLPVVFNPRRVEEIIPALQEIMDEREKA